MKTMTLIFILLITIVSADDHFTCMEKINEIETLKEERRTWLEKAASFSILQNDYGYEERKQDKLREEKIKVLYMELQECK